MVKLEGIIYKTFNHYVVLRGFAPIKDLAVVSHKPDAYQRPAIEQHKEEIISFLSSGEYKYFPEITLACRVEKYDEFARNIGIDNAVDRDDAQFVPGLKVLAQRLPYGYRARHAYLQKDNNTDLVRVDGNHRLEPFDDINSDIWTSNDYDRDRIENLIVPYTIIFSEKEFGDKFEAGIFYNINFKQIPLRMESSLKIIHDLRVFDDIENFGEEYGLALQLMDIAKSNIFENIPWLQVSNDIQYEFYRTSCLRIVQLLLARKNIIKTRLASVKSKLSDVTNNINGNVQKKEKCKQIMQNYSQVGDTIHGSRNKKRSGTNGITKEQYEENKSTLHNLENEWHNLESRKQYLQLLLDNLSNYLKDSNDASKIKRVIMSLGKYYEQFNTQEYGNIAFLAAMVYYALLDTAQLDSFVHWAIRNGINKIVQSDDLSSDAPENLINMFDQIYSSKKNEIFVSMQFGDSQSELIFEKIVRATELFNKKHPHKNLDVYPIRIDRTVESSTYTIQDRILSAIKSCSLIIADLSSHNINVYHEIGYAMGIAEANNMYPNMILLYKEDTEHNKEKQDTDKFVGFNLRSLSQLRFKDYKQLVDGLVERLEKHYEV